jgi:oligoribonuclease NrnB/cAMP/cGMP phosphodiesterase (DHH superfamily)
MIIIYHNRDLDGFTSGAILKKKFPEAQLIGYDYSEQFPVLPDDQDIIMVDVSVPPAAMFDVAIRSKSFVWIDHHASAIKAYNEYIEGIGVVSKIVTPVLKDGIAACEIAWRWAFPDEHLPIAVLLLGTYDTWRNQDKLFWDEVVMPFQYGMRTKCLSPETFPPLLLTNQGSFEVEVTTNTGRTILKYQQEQDAIRAKGAFEFMWRGYHVIAINGASMNSNAFASVYKEDMHDIMMPFKYDGKQWIFSLYTTKEVDCSAIAKTLGGGGHKKAAGFQVKTFAQAELPFEL